VKHSFFYNVIIIYPWFFWCTAVLLLRFFPTCSAGRFITENRIKTIGRGTLFTAAAVYILSYTAFRSGYRYESQIVVEGLLPFILAWPYIKRNINSFVNFILALFPLFALVTFEQLKATQFEQWTYLVNGENRYLLWSRGNGTVLERLFYFGGPDYPFIELVFYPLYILGTYGIYTLAASLTPKKWQIPESRLRWFFPCMFGVPCAVITILMIWFIAVRRDMFPFHAAAAFMSLALMWAFYISPCVRSFTRTRLFAALSVFGIIQMAIFEYYHCGLMGHWVYLPANEIASLHPVVNLKFPFAAAIGGVGGSWPLEEWCAYVTLFVFVQAYLLMCHYHMKIKIFT
jgi:hypothetical protein